MKIHDIPIHGFLPVQFKDTIAKINMITEKEIWNRITAIYSYQEMVQLKNGVNTSGYHFSEEGVIQFSISLPYFNGTSQIYTATTPCISINTGILPDEYWFAHSLLHEVGHHHQHIELDTKKVKLTHTVLRLIIYTILIKWWVWYQSQDFGMKR